MFLGHEALALASRRLAPRPSLGTLVAAATLPDLLWPVFLLLGWEKVRIDPGNTVVTPLDFVRYPYTHSLLAVLLWAALFGGVYGLLRHDRRGAVVCGLLVASHWVLDFISHRPDLPLIPGGPRYGLGLWNSLPATLVAEGALYGCGVWIYVRARPALDRTGVAAFWSVVILLAVLYVLSVWGPPPPDARAIAWVGLASWIFPFWFAWADRHRHSA